MILVEISHSIIQIYTGLYNCYVRVHVVAQLVDVYGQEDRLTYLNVSYCELIATTWNAIPKPTYMSAKYIE